MLKYSGIVESISGNEAIVRIDCGGNCEHCGACSNANAKTLTAKNNIGALVNNKVEISITNFNQKLISVLCYVLPIILTLILALSLMNVVSTLILSILSLICFIIFTCCGIIIANKLSNKIVIKIDNIL